MDISIPTIARIIGAVGAQIAPALPHLPAEDLVISEIHYAPLGGAAEEFIELQNLSDTPALLTGWSLGEGVEITLPPAVLPGNGTLVVAADLAAFDAAHPDFTGTRVGGWMGSLDDRGERITLLNPAGAEIDAVTYANEGTWAERRPGPLDAGHTGWVWSAAHAGAGASLELLQPGLSNDWGHNWTSSAQPGGTPGSSNSSAVVNVPPLLQDLAHEPAIPTTASPITVRVQALDEDPENLSLTLRWRTSSGAAFQAAPMNDSGQLGDTSPGDGEFAATIPAQADGSVVEYYVFADDGDSLERTWPGPTSLRGAQEANALILVDNQLGTSLPLAPGAEPVLRVILTAPEAAELSGLPGSSGASTQALFNATWVAVYPGDVDVRPLCGVGLRGGAPGEVSPSYRVALRRDDPWNGLDRFELDSGAPHCRSLGSALFRELGIPAPVSYPVQLRYGLVNPATSGSPDYGRYSYSQSADDAFAQDQLEHLLSPAANGSSGKVPSVYRAEASFDGQAVPDLSWQGADPGAYAAAYVRVAGSPSATPTGDLLGLLDVLNNAPNDGYFAALNQVADLPQWARYFAWSTLLGDSSGSLSSGIGDDFYIAFDGSDSDPGRALLLPRDLDALLGSGVAAAEPTASVFRAGSVPGLARLFGDSQFLTLYVATVLELLDAEFTTERMDARIDALAGPLVLAAEVVAMKQFVLDRRAGVLAQLGTLANAVDPIAGSVPLADGLAAVTSAALTLTGTAHAQSVHSVRVNGVPAVWNPTTGTWSTGTTPIAWTPLVNAGDIWSYLDDGSDAGLATSPQWSSLDFSAAAWSSGPAPLGYGYPDLGTSVSFGPNPADRHITTYLRHSFSVDDPVRHRALELELDFDDGVVVFLNGVEVARRNVDPIYVGAGDAADVDVDGLMEGQRITLRIPASALRAGENILAAEVHQSSSTSDDLRFAAVLRGLATDAPALELLPGVNQLVVEFLDAAGEPIESRVVDVFFDTGSTTDLSGNLAVTQLLTAAGGPYRIVDSVTILGGAVVEPGTTVFFEPGARLNVRAGALVALGEPHRRIWFGPLPGSGNSAPEVESTVGTYLDCLDYHGAAGAPGTAGFELEGVAVAQRSWFTGRGTDLLRITSASTLVRANEFAPMFGLPPTGVGSDADYVEGLGVLGDYFRIEDNRFGPTFGDNVVIDTLGGGYPNPILEVRRNLFEGAESNVVESNGDVQFEGNLVVGVSAGGSSDAANVVATTGSDRLFAIARNVVAHCQHLFANLGNSFGYVENNTVHAVVPDPHSVSAPIVLAPASGANPGLGSYSAGNIWSQLPGEVFGNPDSGVTSVLEVRHDLAESSAAFTNVAAGHSVEFSVGDPAFTNADELDFSLSAGSAASGAGPFDGDAGALVPGGLRLLSQPAGVLNTTTATLVVGGPGLFAFVYRLDGGPWSEPVSIQDPLATAGEAKQRTYALELAGLSNGAHVAELRGIDLAGRLQPGVLRSQPWTVLTGSSVRISEVLARNVSAYDGGSGAFPDYAEFVNSGAVGISLQGYSLTDDLSEPEQFTFGAAATIAPGEYALLPLTGGVPFALDGDGDALYLFSPAGFLVDSVRFGPQVPDLSLSRQLGDVTWRLTPPTPGSANAPEVALAETGQARISEWLANAGAFDDFVELYNPAGDPLPLGGTYLTNALGQPFLHALRPLSFLAPLGAQEFIADADPLAGSNHLGFKLPKEFGAIGLFDAAGQAIDIVLYGPQQEDVSQGFLFDTDPLAMVSFALPSPGLRNDDAATLYGEVVINEFVASNDSSLFDEDGDDSDWLELKNTSSAAVDLTGWFLTDNPSNLTKWELPEVVLGPDAYVLVFASNKDRALAGSELHTNFKLSAGGEYLALVQPDGQTVAFGYAPSFPPQTTDQAYGRPNDSESPGYLLDTTPAALNTSEALAPVLFSQPTGLFDAPFDLALTANVSLSGGLIHYTLDGSEPTAAAPIYPGPLAIADTTRVRARVVDGSSLGPVTEGVFTELEPEVVGVSSTLPLVVIDSFGTAITSSVGTFTQATATIIERSGGTATLAGVPDYAGNAGVRVRGSSTQNLPKKAFRLELWDQESNDFDADLLGLGSESDWVLYAPGRYDRAFVNNPHVYAGFGELGYDAMGTRFVELYLNDDGDGVDAEDYNGIYILTESIKIGPERVDIEELNTTDVAAPAVTGGYIFSVDRNDNDEHKFRTASGFPPSNWLNIVKPKLDDLAPEQITYVEGYFDAFEAALFGPDFEDPEFGYPAFIDVPSWIDQHITRLYTKDPDAHRLSNFMHKDREGRIVAAPTWDFDRTLESADGRDDDPLEIYKCCDGIDHFNWEWWGRLRESTDYRRAYQDRWYELRNGALSTSAIFARIDAYHAEIAEAYPREDERWGSTSGYGSRFVDLAGEIDNQKDWLSQRLPFLDQFMFTLDAVNLAADEATTQSSDADSEHTSDRAVDGELSGIFSLNFLAATLSEFQPWWEVDLGEVQELGSVRLWNRSDCCATELTQFHVLVSDVPFDSTDLAATQMQPGVGDFYFGATADRLTDVAIGRSGRYVRIQLEGTGALQLAEVEVLEDVNRALFGQTTQSSTEPGFGPELAADASIDGDLGAGSVASTLTELEPWWEVDLGSVQAIDDVRLFGRTDCCPDLLAGAHVLVSDVAFTGSSLSAAKAQPGVDDFVLPPGAGFTERVAVGRSARFVRVQLEGSGPLHLAEVVVQVAP